MKIIILHLIFLAIELNEGIAETKLFYKRDTFKLSVVRMPYKRSNIPQKMFYATIGAEVWSMYPTWIEQ